MTRSLLFVFVLTLLHHSTAQSSPQTPEWFAANDIDDAALAAIPLSQIFSTEQTFSTANPIVVLPSSSPSTVVSSSSFSDVSSSSFSTSFPSSSSTFSSTRNTFSSSTFPSTLSSTLSTFGSTLAPPPQPPQPQLQISPNSQPVPAVFRNGSSSQNYFIFYQQGANGNQNPTTQDNPSTLPPFSSTTFATSTPLSSSTAALGPVNAQFSSTIAPSSSSAPNNSLSAIPYVKIRMLSPSGSITNIQVNPTSSTRRPGRRNQRRNRNNYDNCVNACRGGRAPVCAGPLGVRPVDPDSLKGFPSICHMACHNSFRKNSYEKVIDGRCGRLRNRIRTIDADKLRRDQLNKVQYTIVQNPGTLVEISPLNSK